MPPAQAESSNTNQRAILFVLAASAAFTLAAALVKAVAGTIPTFEIMLFRTVFALPIMLPFVYPQGWVRTMSTRHVGRHLLRGAAGFMSMYGPYYGYAVLPLALVTALGFAMPMFLAILSVPMLGERLGRDKLVSIGAGLLGVLVVLRPWKHEGAVELGPALIVVLGVMAWALAMVSIRKMGQAGERNVTIVLWFTVLSAIASGLLTIPVWVTPGWLDLLWLIGVGVVSGVAQLLMTEGYGHGEASVLAPFEYGAIIYAVLLGWAIWGEVPGVWEASGILLLILAGLFTWWRQRGPLPAPNRPGPGLPWPRRSAARPR